MCPLAGTWHIGAMWSSIEQSDRNGLSVLAPCDVALHCCLGDAHKWPPYKGGIRYPQEPN